MAKAADKLAAVTSVTEPLDVNFDNLALNFWTYNFQGKDIYTWDFESQMTDIRVLLNIQQASTVEVDLDDSDFQVLQDPLFAQWAWNIEDVSFSSQKQFKTTRLQNTTNTSYLGDSADLEWVLGQKPIDFKLNDQIFFRLCGFQGQQTTLTLEAEDRVASYLRQYTGALSVNRDSYTRAQFVAMLCKQAGVDYFIPELDVIQPISIDTTASSTSTANIVNPNGKGLSNDAKLTVLGLPMTATQKKVANILLGECDALSADIVCWQAILYAGVGETGLGTNAHTYTPNKDGAVGVLQGTNSYWHQNPTDIKGQADSFLKGGLGFQGGGAIALAHSGITDPEQIAITVEVPSHWPSNAYEQEWGSAKDAQLLNEINQIIAAYGGPSSTGSSAVTTTSGSYAFTRGANETSWDCIQRLASEVAWYAFVRQNRLWYVSGNYLFAQPAQLTAEIGKGGIDYIDPNVDVGARDGIAECMIYGRTSLWTALPGMVVEVVNRGPCSGKWIVASVENHPLDATQQCIITLQKPLPERAEPQTGGGSTTTIGQNTAAQGTAGGAYWAAQQLAAKKLVYTKANRTMVPLTQIKQGETLYDCSASVSWVLLRAGFALPGGITWGGWAPVSGDFTAGQAGLVAGPGQYMTIWANSDHIFIEFNIPGVGHYQGNTVNPYGPGFGLFSWNTPATGGWGGPNPGQGAPAFTPVHYPGT